MPDRVRAPEFDAALGWLNTDRPLRLRDELRGHVVVLDFWTYCCINCMHILPDLKQLEEKYAAEPVVFLGVHSAKFANEASRETIRAAMHRYEIRHPVLIDDQMKIWRSYGVRSWPTIVVIDAEGTIVGTAAGEGTRDEIDRLIAEALEQGRSRKALAKERIAIRLDGNVRAATGLAFPGKIHADAESNRLFVADSNHNRIIVAELPDDRGHARLIKVVGSGAIGRDDGPAESATFHHPQGVASAYGNLYVCDTENNLIRMIDLSTFEVTTIVGTGEMSNDRAGGGMGVAQGINWPWDVCIEGATLYVAMAGLHQIWRIDLPVGFARAFAGTGRENLADGPTETSAWAQPSGICLMGGSLYVADSEVSAIRGIDMAAERVFTIIGQGLFYFGDEDGAYPKAKLQHPLGVAAWGNSLIVADTYNHKIKLVDPASRSVRTLFGSGKPGTGDPRRAADFSPRGGSIANEIEFFEPGGVSVIGDDLFVADTNNHRIVRFNLVTGAWHEVIFDGLAAPCFSLGSAGATAHAPAHGVTDSDSAYDEAVEPIELPPVSLATGHDIELVIDVKLPPGAKLSPEAPWSVRIDADGKTLFQRTGKSDTLPIRTSFRPDVSDISGSWTITAAFVYCDDRHGGVCVPVSQQWRVSVSHNGMQSDIRCVAEAAQTE